jgi:hypothetical protein
VCACRPSCPRFSFNRALGAGTLLRGRVAGLAPDTLYLAVTDEYVLASPYQLRSATDGLLANLLFGYEILVGGSEVRDRV